MSRLDAHTLQHELNLSDGDLDEDPCVAITGLITSAVREGTPLRTLEQIYEALERLESASFLEPLSLLPLLIPCRNQSAEQLILLMARQSSAKEIIMAAQEVLEKLEIDSQSDEQPENGQEELSSLRQITRLIVVYSLSIPRLPKRNKTPSQILRPLFTELGSVVSQVGPESTAAERQALTISSCRAVSTIYTWVASDTSYDADEKVKVLDVLYSFLASVLEMGANDINANLARKAFARFFPRLVMPPSESESTETVDASHDLQTATATLDLDPHRLEAQPSLSSLILLAHSPSYAFSIPVLTSFFPIILMSLQSNTALDETLSVLISSIVPFRSQSPLSDFPPDLMIPLVHILPSLASIHPEPSTRHQTFRLLGSVLSLAPSPLRLHSLQDLLTDADTSPQMRVAAVGLVKEAVLEALATPASSPENVFASPTLLRSLGPAILQPHPPDLFSSGRSLSADDFLETAEPLRLVECLALYYVWLLRDVRNRTAVRDPDNLRSVERTLVEPLRQQLKVWDNASGGSMLHGEESAMQLAILDMWLDRVSSAVETIRAECT